MVSFILNEDVGTVPQKCALWVSRGPSRAEFDQQPCVQSCPWKQGIPTHTFSCVLFCFPSFPYKQADVQFHGSGGEVGKEPLLSLPFLIGIEFFSAVVTTTCI